MIWTPDLIDKAGKMFMSGNDWDSIAAAVGCSVNAARRKLYRVRIDQGSRGKKRLDMGCVVSIRMNPEAWRSINESASARGKSLEAMMSDIAELMADPVLLENVLDDGVSL